MAANVPLQRATSAPGRGLTTLHSLLHVVCDYLQLHTRDKRFWLYDVFDWSPQDKHVHFEGLDAGLHDTVVQRFSAMPYVHIVQGHVPASFAKARLPGA